jgi:hypothetical protein
MNLIMKSLSIIIISVILFSCNGKTEINEANKQEIPKALQDNFSEVKSYSRSSDLSEELYQELVEETPSLKKLEEDIIDYQNKCNEAMEPFNKYNNNSNNYYSSSKYKAESISDSTLKNKILTIISESNNKYNNKISEHTSLLSLISKGDATLNDQHLAMKILLTIPIIEKYQDNNKTDLKELLKMKNDQSKLIEQVKSLTPKN